MCLNALICGVFEMLQPQAGSLKNGVYSMCCHCLFCHVRCQCGIEDSCGVIGQYRYANAQLSRKMPEATGYGGDGRRHLFT